MNVTKELEYAEEGQLPPLTKERGLSYHLKTVYLVTKSDVKTTILPATTFAFTAVFSGLLTTESTSGSGTVLSGLLKSILWTWMNLWIFNLANQRLEKSILEDSINKPWRAIPSGRLSPEEARRLLLLSIPVVFLSTFYLGGRNECMLLMVLTWIYNDLGAAEEHFFFRHVANALGFTSFGAGAAQVASAGSLNMTTYYWLAVIAAAITFTIQFQDMEDQEGDRMRDRKTLPIVLGDATARHLNAVTIVVFSLAAPAFWQLTLLGYLFPTLLGLFIAVRTLAHRDLASDKQTFKLWCLWLMLLYLLPLAKNLCFSRLWPDSR
ncbi:hypothetical protein EG329_000875 [Mollisiaceae sp. DMI_Dod_QoI]|nr:hypothetical protein EG329_000875 [Helotiales sp. DMI_Dod_QoI]